jgi:hypothetical protein
LSTWTRRSIDFASNIKLLANKLPCIILVDLPALISRPRSFIAYIIAESCSDSGFSHIVRKSAVSHPLVNLLVKTIPLSTRFRENSKMIKAGSLTLLKTRSYFVFPTRLNHSLTALMRRFGKASLESNSISLLIRLLKPKCREI